MFVDRVTLQLTAGKGGNGLVAWRREKHLPKGGPYGGNGGPGGNIIFLADVQCHSLDWYRRRHLLKAENGQIGGVNLRKGRKGVDLLLKVPCGTIVRDSATGEVLCDLVESGERWLACQGGRGGRGNHSFRNPRRQAPDFATPGSEGEEKTIELELKLVADVGLVGLPNAGKSTLLQSLTAAHSKAAPYPFTTLTPHLGCLELEDYRRISIADIPGIIEGAHANRGLGHDFLRHIERTKLLLFILDGSGMQGSHPTEDLLVLFDELRRHDPSLLERPRLVLFNKIDCESGPALYQEFLERHPEVSGQLLPISAWTGEGLDQLPLRLSQLLFSPSSAT